MAIWAVSGHTKRGQFHVRPVRNPICMICVGVWVLVALTLSSTAFAAGTIRFAGTFSSFVDGMEDVIKRFEEETGITVEILPSMDNSMAERIVTMAAGGIAPDVLYSHSRIVKELSEMGLLEPLDARVERDGVDLDAFAPLAVEYLRHDGLLYALPSAINPNPFYTNNALLERAGVPPLPTTWGDGSWTFNDFVEVTKRLTVDTNGDGTPNLYGFSNGTAVESLLSFFDLQWTDESRTRFLGAEPAQVEAMTQIASLYTQHGVVNPSGFGGSGGFRDGGSAIAYAHGGVVNTLAEDGFPRWTLAAIPFAKKTYGSVHNWAVYKDSPQADLAWELVKYLAYNQEGNQYFSAVENRVPTLRGSAQPFLERMIELAPESNPQVLIGAMDYIWHYRLSEGLNGLEASNYLRTVSQEVVTGNKSVHGAYSEAKPVIEGILAQ